MFHGLHIKNDNLPMLCLNLITVNVNKIHFLDQKVGGMNRCKNYLEHSSNIVFFIHDQWHIEKP